MTCYGDSTTFPGFSSPTFTGTMATAALTATGQVSARRHDAHGGTVLVANDYALSAGWGTSPVFTAVRGTDCGAAFTVQAKATVGANPTVTLTFHDGAWANGAPIVVCGRTEIVTATGAPAAAVTNEFVATTVSTTQIIFTFNGTPVANSTYGCSFICMGV